MKSILNIPRLIFAVLSCAVFLFLIAGANFAVAQSTQRATHATAEKPTDIVRDPTDLPAPIGNRAPAMVHVTLTAEEVLGTLDPQAGSTYHYWTFNGKVPGPMIRVRQGDTIQLTLRNNASSHMVHSIDLHAALGPGGGAALSQVLPGQSKTFTFQATTAGLFVYHCGTPMIAEHMANGMYGLILVEPEGGLSKVDHEYYIMQGEIYTAAPMGKQGLQQFSAAKLMHETPEYFVFNGAVDALTAAHQMPSKVGETIRIFLGNAGPNEASASHVVGTIFSHVYQLGSLSSPPLDGVQTVGVPPGAAAIAEFVTRQPGKFALMDHSISRMAKGDMAVFNVTGPEDPRLMHAGEATVQEAQAATVSVNGITQADDATNLPNGQQLAASNTEPKTTSATAPGVNGITDADDASNTAADAPADSTDAGTTGAMASSMDGMNMGGMEMGMHGTMRMQPASKSAARLQSRNSDGPAQTANASPASSLQGCLTIASDGRAILNVLQSTKRYRLEAQPLLFSENANRIVNVSGYFGSVMRAEDPRLTSFVVKSIDQLAPNCKVKMSIAQAKKALLKQTEAVRGLVGMSDMGFLPQTLEVNVGDKVVWRNSSEVTHNVVADPARALYSVDIKLPSGVSPFGSGYLQPGQTFSHVFNVPGVYHYVCTLHEGSGMKGVIIVKGGADVLTARK